MNLFGDAVRQFGEAGYNAILHPKFTFVMEDYIMKKVVIMGFISICSAIIVSAIIIAAGSYSQTLTSWSGASRFWYTIFGSSPYEGGVNLSMNLGAIFIIFSILLLVGMTPKLSISKNKLTGSYVTDCVKTRLMHLRVQFVNNEHLSVLIMEFNACTTMIKSPPVTPQGFKVVAESKT